MYGREDRLPDSLCRAVCERESIDISQLLRCQESVHNGHDKSHASLQDSRVHKGLYSDRDVHLTAEAEISRLKVQEVYNTQKSLGRSRADHRKQLAERVA